MVYDSLLFQENVVKVIIACFVLCHVNLSTVIQCPSFFFFSKHFLFGFKWLLLLNNNYL